MKKEIIPDKALELCPEELPEGLIPWIRREIIDMDNTLIYKRGNVRGLCYICGQKVTSTGERFKQNYRVTCPSCGSKVWCVLEDGANWKADYVDNIAAAQMGKDGKTVFIRQWHVVRDPEARFQQTERWLKEIARYAIRGELIAKWQKEIKESWYMQVHRYPIDYWERVNNYSVIYDGGYTFYMPSIASAVAGTPLQYKAIEKYAAGVQNPNVIRYMIDAARYPILEFFVKNGYTWVVNERCSLGGADKEGMNAIRWQRKKLQECFHFPLRLLKLKEPAVWQLRDFKKLNDLWECHRRGGLEEKDIGRLMETGIDFKCIIAAAPYASVAKILKYLEVQQQARRYHVEADYRDYLAECQQLGLDLSDKQVLFPRDLMEAHRRTTAQINFEKNKADQEKFIKAVEALAKYTWSKDGFIIRAAQTQEELQDEGAALHHCVAGYAERMAAGETAIFFIRRAEDVEKPFFTLELRNKKVIQCRTLHNDSYEKNPDVKDFVDKWLKSVVAKGGVKKKKAA